MAGPQWPGLSVFTEKNMPNQMLPTPDISRVRDRCDTQTIDNKLNCPLYEEGVPTQPSTPAF
jgi:hypothetical protein